MYQNGPKIRGDNKLSFTVPAIKITRKTAQTAGQCHYKNYRISSVYSFVLPKLESSKGVPKQTLAKWNGFASYLYKHENLHREIWLKCLSEFEAEAKALSTSDCDALEKDAAQAFETKKLACLGEDQKLDFYHSKEALKTPFLREALETPRK
jgi:predicted secreted Zn-dependent protease